MNPINTSASGKFLHYTVRNPLAILLWLSALALTGAAQPVDLQPQANTKLEESLHDAGDGNNLAELPKGEQTFAGSKFKIGDKYIRLGSTADTSVPKRVEGIKVGKPAAALNILHATGFGSYLKPGDDLYVDDGTPIGEYVINYEDKSTAKIPIIYGKHVRDWFNWDDSKPVADGKVAWEGDNKLSKQVGKKIRLFLTTWKNPMPDKPISTIDYISNGKTVCAPFCVAITGEKVTN